MSENHQGEKHSFYGKHHSEETKNKISEASKKNNIGKGNPFYGKKHTLSTKLKMSANHADFKGEKSPNARKVICIETINIFKCVKDAASFINKDYHGIINTCKGKQKTCGGYHWMYYEEYLNEQKAS